MSEDRHPGWRRIQTAPKDGTRILCLNRAGEVFHGFWSPAQDDNGDDYWWNEPADDIAFPIWWMPALPDPPAEGTRP